jgi:tRNA-splicing ligase RtcB
MRWAQEYALLNREEMMDRVVACFAEWVGAEVERQEEIDCHHNYTEQERHFGREVWLSRKGAIDASAGRPGLIPGSMGTASYVVSGLGNPLALNSAPHGAGRRTHGRRHGGRSATTSSGRRWSASSTATRMPSSTRSRRRTRTSTR